MAESDRNKGRNGRWWRDHVSGMTLEAIAERDNTTAATVSRAIKQVRDSIPEVERTELRKKLADLYERLTLEALEIAQKVPAPVTAGKDGDVVRDPETGQVVRDYSGRLRAMETAAAMADRARKMFGVDEAQRVQVSTGEDEEARRLAAESRAYLEQEETEA